MKAGKLLESYVQFVYSKLLQFMDDADTLVSTNVSIQGRSGAKNEFDVYYEFCHLNVRHRIAIECKDWVNPVTIKEVRDFCAKLDDLNNITGMMVAKSGYQSGAKIYAESKGVKLLEEKDLPTLVDIVCGVIKNGFLPDKNVEGRPFWTLMEVQNGEITGTYFSLPITDKPIVPLFFSKKIAQNVLDTRPDSRSFEVRGISQYQLKGFIAQMETGIVEAAICDLPFWNENELNVSFACISTRELKENFVY